MKQSKQTAALLTAAVCVLILLALVLGRLTWNPGQPWPPLPEPYIVLDDVGEFAEPEIKPLPANAPEDLDAPALAETRQDVPSEAAPQSGASVEQRGKVADPPKTVTAPKPSKVKEKPAEKPKDPGAATRNEAREREAAARRTNNNVRDAFSNSKARNNANNSNADKGKSGSPSGRADSGGPANSASSTVGLSHGSLSGGWQWPEYRVAIRTDKTGTVRLRLTIDSTGAVTAADPIGGEPPAASDPSLQKKCIRIALSKRFTRSGDSPAPARATATLTFLFRAPKS